MPWNYLSNRNRNFAHKVIAHDLHVWQKRWEGTHDLIQRDMTIVVDYEKAPPKITRRKQNKTGAKMNIWDHVAAQANRGTPPWVPVDIVFNYGDCSIRWIRGYYDLETELSVGRTATLDTDIPRVTQ